MPRDKHTPRGDVTVGQIIDGLGIPNYLPDGALVSTAVVLLALVDGESGEEYMAMLYPENQSRYTRAGLLRVAESGEVMQGGVWE